MCRNKTWVPLHKHPFQQKQQHKQQKHKHQPRKKNSYRALEKKPSKSHANMHKNDFIANIQSDDVWKSVKIQHPFKNGLDLIISKMLFRIFIVRLIWAYFSTSSWCVCVRESVWVSIYVRDFPKIVVINSPYINQTNFNFLVASIEKTIPVSRERMNVMKN